MSYWDWKYDRKPLIKPKGGIKSQSKQGKFGESWWAKRWIAVLEGFNIGARLGRGKSYARNGQVVSIDIDKGKVKAKVQGTSSTPYKISIEIPTLSTEDWRKVVDELSSQAIFAAKLLAGEMPNEIESVFSQSSLSLFPRWHGDLKTNCSCPDWSNPCKHIAAVYYLIGEEFDRDPFLIFKLRGVTREEFLKMMGEVPVSTEAQEVVEALPPEPLSTDVAKFWGLDNKLPDDFFGEVEIPVAPSALPRRLGSLSFWRSDMPFIDAMETFYQQAAKRGLDIFVGDSNR